MNKLFKNLALGTILVSCVTLLSAEDSTKEEASSVQKNPNQKFDGWAFRFSEYGHVSGFLADKESQYPVLANVFIYLDAAARYGKTINNSGLWIGGEINPLNITWKHSDINGNAISNFYYYYPHASVVLGWIENNILTHMDLGVGYCIPFANQETAAIKMNKGGVGFKAKIGADYLVNNQTMVGLSGELRYIFLEARDQTNMSEKISHLEYSIGFTCGYQF